MGYKTITTKIASARSTKSKQTTSYQYPTGNGVVLTGSSINSQTSAYLDVTAPGAARSFTAVSGGGTSTVISNIQYLDANNVVANAIAASTTGGNILINGNGFANTNRVYVNNQLVTNTFVNSNAIIATLSANSVGNVTLAVFNSSGQSGVFSNSNVRFSGAPSWVSAAAVSSVNGIASNIALQASGDGTLTYSLKSGSGSLPTGITLLSSGYLTGTVTGYSADTVVSFTLIVSDNESQEAQQNFNYTVFIGDTYFKQTSLLLSATVSNTFISDSSTNNFLITRNGDTRPSRLSPYWPGGWSGYFDGTGDYLSLSAAPINTTGNFTAEAWVYVSSTSVGALFTFRTQNDAYAALRVFIENQQLGLLMSTTGTSWTINSGLLGSVPLNSWNHIAFTRNGGTITLYINGVSVYTSTGISAGTALMTGTNNYIGTLYYTAGGGFIQYLSGYISNLRVVNGTALYTGNFTPSTTSLTTVANTSLLTLRDAILADDSPYNFTITRNGDTRLTTFSPFNTTPHTITANTNSVYFDGTGDYLSVASNTEFNLGTGDFTIECWLYVISYPNDFFIVSSTGSGGLFVGFRNSANPKGWGYGRNTIAWDYVSGVLPVENTWQHFAITRSGTSIKMFINGNQIGTTQTSSTSFDLSTTSMTIGSQGATYYYNGYMSNFRVLKGTALYTANFTPATSALTTIANTSILACQANTIIDSNTTPKTITINGNPNVSLANPFGETVSTISNYTWSANSYGASAYFDGTGDYLNAGSNAAFAFGTGAYTIECWVYPTALNIAVFVGIRATGGLQLFYDTTSGVGLSNVGSPGFLFAGTLSLNQWYHLAAVRNSTASNDTRIYINGTLRAIGTDSTNWTVNGPFIIAANQNGTETFTGYMTDVRWTKGTALYTTSFVPPAAPVSNVANVSLLTLQSDIGSNSAQFVDQSPNNHLITRNGNASQGTYGPLVPSTWSAYFDGTGDSLSVTRNTAFLPGANEDFTFEAWVYLISTPGAQNAHIMGFTEYGTDGDWVFGIDSSRQLYFYMTSTFGTYLNTSTLVNINQWTHVAVSRSGTGSNNLKVFVNGVGQGHSVNNTTVGTGNRNLSIGADQDSNESNLSGYISNLRIVKGTALYTANFTPSTTTISPVTNTSLLTLRGPGFTDDGPNNFTITRNGDTKIVPFGPFSPQIVTPDSYSYRFSNASDYISTTSSNLAFGSNNWTIESWVYPRFTANSGVFQVSNVQYGLTNSNLNTVALGFSNSNKAIVRVANATYTSTGTSITANTWTHLALVKSSNISKLYINGTLDSTIGTSGSITDTVSYTGTTNVAVGGYGSTSALANAYISNFRVVSNSAVYIENFTPAVGPLSAISGTTLLTCQANTVIDSSAANLTITANANVTPVNFNPFDETVTVGQQYSALADGGSAYFDGSSNSYLLLPQDVKSFAFGTLPYTVEFWIYMEEYIGSYHRILDVPINNGLGIQINNTGTIAITNNSGISDVLVSSASFTLKNWNHVAVTRTSVSSNSTQIFLNGLRIALGTDSTTWSASASLRINGISGTGGYWKGYLSNLRIVKGTALYTANFVPPAAPALPTVANTSLLLNFTSSGVIDSTGRNVLETVADAKVTTNLKKYGNGSYYFDGTGDYMYVMGNSTELAFGAGDFTIEFWMYTSNAAQSAVLYDSRPSATQGLYPTIYIASNILYYYNNSADRITGGTLVNNTWHHVALARSGTSTKMFLDGTQVGSTYTDSSNYLNSSGKPIIGNNNGPTSPYLGYISDLRITKGYARYTANFTVPSEPFITK